MQAGNQQQVTLASRPQGKPQLRDFQLVDTDVAGPAEGELLIQTLYLSVDPGMRRMMGGDKSYSVGFEVGQPLTGRPVGRVVNSKHPHFAIGDYATNGCHGSTIPCPTATVRRRSIQPWRHCRPTSAWSAFPAFARTSG